MAMKIRNTIMTDTLTPVFFGSTGTTPSGKKVQAQSFVESIDAVTAALNQRLSIIKNELWYNMSFGLPLIDKVSSKYIVDAAINEIVLNTQHVVEITRFESSISGHTYKCNMTIKSDYGVIQLSL